MKDLFSSLISGFKAFFSQLTTQIGIWKQKLTWSIVISLILSLVGLGGIISGLILLWSIGNTSDVQLELSDSQTNQDLGSITVSVMGVVANPGVYTLKLGDRVAQAIEAAGGLGPGVGWSELPGVNLAAKVSDGQQLIIASVSAQVATSNSESKSDTSQTSLINLNTASASELDSLPDIGPARAEDIMANRPYESLEAVVEKGAMTITMFEKLKHLITI